MCYNIDSKRERNAQKKVGIKMKMETTKTKTVYGIALENEHITTPSVFWVCDTLEKAKATVKVLEKNDIDNTIFSIKELTLEYSEIIKI